MSKRPLKIPSRRLHKPSGLSVCTIDGKDFYLGKHDSEEAKKAYDDLVAEWLANGRRFVSGNGTPREVTVKEVVAAYFRHAEKHYRAPDGSPSQEIQNMLAALKPVTRLYRDIEARAFGPLALRAVRESMVCDGLARKTINARVQRIRRAFRWATSVEMIPPSIHQALATVQGLQIGRTEAPELPPVVSVPMEDVEKTLVHLGPVTAAMVRFQLLTACRVGEVLKSRRAEISQNGDTWEYRPRAHKTSWRGKGRTIVLGPRAIEVLKPFLDIPEDAHLFSPRRAVELARAQRAAERKSKRQPSQIERAENHKANPKLPPGAKYSRRTYLTAIFRACDKAGVPRWSPLQLRHTAATEIRKRFGLESAQAVLGHARADTTQIYAERDENRAREVMRQIG